VTAFPASTQLRDQFAHSPYQVCKGLACFKMGVALYASNSKILQIAKQFIEIEGYMSR
jgi:hypothetical protein